jgi:hypothetical protein
VIAVPELVGSGDGREPYFRIVEVYTDHSDESQPVRSGFITTVPVEKDDLRKQQEDCITTSEGSFRRSDWESARQEAKHLTAELREEWRGQADVTSDDTVHITDPLTGEDAVPHFQVKITPADGEAAQVIIVPIVGAADRGSQ